ncbi:hypothetical protein JX266_005041 [Neoarthrinium moseri]|nr:hypothetical protein JX266_005041 [Neoarthrinium moseri]
MASVIQFFIRLGFTAPTQAQLSEWDQYLCLSHPNGSDIHLRQLGTDEEGWLVPTKNSFGIYVYSEDVEALGVDFADEIIEAGKKPEVKEWGLLEFSVNGPDGCLVRVGWPADEIEKKKAAA